MVLCTVTLHVDDLMISCKDQALIDKVVADITYVYKEVWMQRGKIRPYLGMMFDFTKKGKVIVVMDMSLTYDKAQSERQRAVA